MSRPPLNPENPSSDPSDDGSGSSGGQEPVTAADSRRPRALAVIATIVAAEAIALLAAGCWYAYELITGAPVLSFWGAVFTLALLLAFSVWLFTVGHFLFRGYRWTRSAALVAQAIVLTIGFPTLTGGLLWAGLAMVVPALTAIVLLFDKRVIAYASRTGGSSPAL
ncbi:hypothetical protein QFZ40_001222 [Arthrobacter pascens]|nr:hypothetical protein [Arthrobacter pascens]